MPTRIRARLPPGDPRCLTDGRRSGAPRRATRLLRRGRDGHQGAGVDGAGLRSARVLLPRDRPQQGGRRPIRSPRRRLRRRHRRGAGRRARSCCRPTVRRPRWSAAARAKGGYVVDSVCPLVTKVHHEVKVRAGKGYHIVYVGHEGHEEAVGTMAVAPEAMHRVETVADVADLPEFDEPVALLAQTTLSHRDWAGVLDATHGSLPRPVDAGTQRPVLRDHQPSVGADGDGAALRRHRRHRLGKLVEHASPREAGRRGRLRPSGAGEPRRRAARRPRRHRRRDRRRVGTRGARRSRDRPSRSA